MMPFPLEKVFSAANTLALLCWLALIFLPRRWWLYWGLQGAIVLGLCLPYAVLIQASFFTVEGGGFFSLIAVQKLFTSPAVALAGWMHYLAFDLFVGLWIARKSDAFAVPRELQALLLGVTFMFGPVGLLLFAALYATRLRDSKGMVV